MSTEELLRPRYKVIAPDTSGLFEVGQYLIHPIDWLDYIWQIDNARKTTIFHPENFPHLFKKLEWWEERSIEGFPEYVKCVKTPDQNIKPEEVFKVKWCTPSAGRAATGQWIVADTNCYIPATSSEYEQYINQKEKQ